MALVKISRGADIQHNYVNGVSRVSILEGAYKDATVERISLQPGADFSAELYTREQHNQVFLITAGKGYIVTPRRVFNITEVSVFVPDFDKESVTFHCAADAKETMEIVHFVTELNDYDKTCLKEAHMSLPRFRGVSGAWHYKEDFTGADIQQMMLLEHRNLGRLVADIKPRLVCWKGGHLEEFEDGLHAGRYGGAFCQVTSAEDMFKGLAACDLGSGGGVILFKGSRSNKLETLVSAFTEAQAGEPHAV